MKIRSDNGKEFDNTNIEEYCDKVVSHPVLETKPSANHVCARISLTTYTA